MSKLYTILCLVIVSVFFSGCSDDIADQPAVLRIEGIKFSGELAFKFLDLPDGVYQPDDPNFHPDRPETWTGNMAKYVKHMYTYNIEFTIVNTSGGVAYDTEVDLYFDFNNGETEVKTLYLGNIQPKSSSVNSTFINTINKQLETCSGEVYWW
ncbi:MAG: hypothetical protein H6606_11395 [Flavobacteriales bacterium]|nr:hypothetical protein [Flavobacteriales bacterium]